MKIGGVQIWQTAQLENVWILNLAMCMCACAI